MNLQRKEVPFMGHVVSEKGLQADPAKIKAVLEMPTPTDVASVRRFIGFTNYLSKFLPQLSDALELLRKLNSPDVEWFWTDIHDSAVQQVKLRITKAPVLEFFDSTESLTSQCDASDKGLGAVLLQKGQPIAYASRALTDAESRYAQIEKELLAVVYDLERFHTYTYGKRSVCGIRPQASGSYFQEATASNSEEASAHAHASSVVQRQTGLQERLLHVSGRHPKSGLFTLR